MARRKNSFMKMKGFKDICKLNAALCRLLRLDFKRDLDSFRYTLPDVAYDEDTVVHLPTRDAFDFLLLRLIAVCELYKRIVECCVEAGGYFSAQLRLHFFFETNTLLLAVIAKIYSLSLKLGNLAIHFYNHIHRHRFKLPSNEKSKFLVNSTELPQKLETINRKQNVPEEFKSKSTTIACAANTSVEPDIRDLLKQEKEIMTPVKAKNLKKTDVGKMVERNNKNKTFDIDELKTVADLKQFIVAETKARSSNLSNCITKQVLSHEWAGATKLFERKVQKGEEMKGLSIFKKFLGSKLL